MYVCIYLGYACRGTWKDGMGALYTLGIHIIEGWYERRYLIPDGSGSIQFLFLLGHIFLMQLEAQAKESELSQRKVFTSEKIDKNLFHPDNNPPSAGYLPSGIRISGMGHAFSKRLACVQWKVGIRALYTWGIHTVKGWHESLIYLGYACSERLAREPYIPGVCMQWKVGMRALYTWGMHAVKGWYKSLIYLGYACSERMV